MSSKKSSRKPNGNSLRKVFDVLSLDENDFVEMLDALISFDFDPEGTRIASIDPKGTFLVSEVASDDSLIRLDTITGGLRNRTLSALGRNSYHG